MSGKPDIGYTPGSRRLFIHSARIEHFSRDLSILFQSGKQSQKEAYQAYLEFGINTERNYVTFLCEFLSKVSGNG